MMPMYRLIHWILTALMPIFFPITIVGKENVPKDGPLIICSNHVSYIDPVFLITKLKRQVFFMAKEELFKNPLLKLFLKSIGTFPVKRGAGDQSALNRAVEIINEGKILGIYAEGTRSKDGVPKKAKSGVALIAARTGSNVLPVAVCAPQGKVKVFRRTTVVIGEVIPSSELKIDETNRREIRSAADKIMSAVHDLWKARQPESESGKDEIS